MIGPILVFYGMRPTQVWLRKSIHLDFFYVEA
jgi:hypothetical protein